MNVEIKPNKKCLPPDVPGMLDATKSGHMGINTRPVENEVLERLHHQAPATERIDDQPASPGIYSTDN